MKKNFKKHIGTLLIFAGLIALGCAGCGTSANLAGLGVSVDVAQKGLVAGVSFAAGSNSVTIGGSYASGTNTLAGAVVIPTGTNN